MVNIASVFSALVAVAAGTTYNPAPAPYQPTDVSMCNGRENYNECRACLLALSSGMIRDQVVLFKCFEILTLTPQNTPSPPDMQTIESAVVAGNITQSAIQTLLGESAEAKLSGKSEAKTNGSYVGSAMFAAEADIASWVLPNGTAAVGQGFSGGGAVVQNAGASKLIFNQKGEGNSAASEREYSGKDATDPLNGGARIKADVGTSVDSKKTGSSASALNSFSASVQGFKFDQNGDLVATADVDKTP